MTTSYEELRELYGEIADLDHASALLSWDQQTYMPPRGSESRGRQLATLSGLSHEKLSNPRIEELLNTVEDEGDPVRAGFLRELKYQRERKLKLPASLVKEMTLETSRAFDVWRQARREKNFQLFSPNLDRVIQLTRQAAECFGYEKTPWDALVPDYERGSSAEKLTAILAPLRDATVKLLEQIRSKPQVPTGFLEQKWDLAQQREFGLRVARDIGYDFAGGRQDVAPHPFCTTLGFGDVRITTRYKEDALLDAVGSTVHEAGHALYEQGFAPELARTPLFDAPSLGMHESQSRFWEIRIAQSRPFWGHYLPILHQYFPGQLDGVGLDDFYRGINRVEPSYIRVESDEVCYNLHVMIRFEIEQRIFDGSLETAGIPETWNRLYKEYLGVTVPNDALGCLQDVHWAYGSFGYFPTYSLGNICCAMLVEKMEHDMPGIWESVQEGRFVGILAWLRENIHRYGRLYGTPELMKRVTGKEISADALVRYLQAKYTEIYQL